MWLLIQSSIFILGSLRGIDSLDSKGYTEWFDKQLEGTLLSALEVDCDWTLPDAGVVKKSYTVICPSQCLNVQHCVRVKGSGPYTVNSPVCLAAIHAGVIPANKGGAIEVSVVEGRPKYSATFKNGVGTVPYGAYFASFDVKKSDVSCGPKPTLPDPCVEDALLDVVFVADSSSSVRLGNFTLEKDFIADLVSHFPISPTMTRVGLVTFNAEPKTRFRLETFKTKSEVLSAIAAVPYEKGGTFLSTALDQVKTNMIFRSDPKVHKIVVVFTDGRLYQEDHFEESVKQLADKVDDIIVLGVGNKAEDILLQVAYGKKDNVFEADSYIQLRSKLESLVTKICSFVLLKRGT